MKSYQALLLGSILALINLYIYANHIEHGDKNAIFLYFLIYSIPVMFLSLLNGLVLILFSQKSQFIKIISGLFFPLLFMVFVLLDDRFLNFIGILGLMPSGSTNLLWTVTNLKKRTIANKT